MSLEAKTAGPRLDVLTPREKEVARTVALGLTNTEIAKKLGVKPRTVTAHLEHIYPKLEIRSRADLVRVVPHGT